LNRNRKKTEPLKKEKNRDPGSRSGIRENLSRIRGVKKAPDLGFGIATLAGAMEGRGRSQWRRKSRAVDGFFMPLVAGSHHFDKEQDPDPHQIKRSGPDPHQSEQMDPDPHQIKWSGPDPHQSEQMDPDPQQSQRSDPDPHPSEKVSV
jgi:hypothetical protein